MAVQFLLPGYRLCATFSRLLGGAIHRAQSESAGQWGHTVPKSPSPFACPQLSVQALAEGRAFSLSSLSVVCGFLGGLCWQCRSGQGRRWPPGPAPSPAHRQAAPRPAGRVSPVSTIPHPHPWPQLLRPGQAFPQQLAGRHKPHRGCRPGHSSNAVSLPGTVSGTQIFCLSPAPAMPGQDPAGTVPGKGLACPHTGRVLLSPSRAWPSGTWWGTWLCHPPERFSGALWEGP